MRFSIPQLRPLLPALLWHLLGGIHASRAAEPADSLALEAFLARAWDASHRPAALVADWQAARAVRGQAHALRGPTLQAELSGGYASRHQELQMAGRSIEFGDGSNLDAALSAAWTLYAGGSLEAGERRGDALVQARREEQLTDSLRLAGELRAAFLGALSAAAARDNAALAVERLERHLKELELRRQSGTLNEEALLQARGRLSQVRQDLALREGELAMASLDLGAWIGQPGRAVRPLGDLAGPLPGLESGACRPGSLAVLEAQLRAARAQERQQEAWRRPRLDASAGWHWGRPGVDPVDNEWMGYATVGLRLRWSLWDGRLGRLRESEAGSTRKAWEDRLAEAERESAGQLARAREWVGAALAAWEEAASRGELESRRLDLVELRWRQGMATERDWLDAQDDLRQARLEEIQGAARLRLAENRLLLAMGR